MNENTEKKVNIFELWDKKVLPILNVSKKYFYVPLIIAIALGAYGYVTEASKEPVFSTSITFMLEDEIGAESQKTGVGGQLLMALAGQAPTSNKAILVDLSISNKLIEQTLLRESVFDKETAILVNKYIELCGFRKSWEKKKNTKALSMKFEKDYKIGTDTDKDYWLRVFSNTIKLTLTGKAQESGLLKMDFSTQNELFTKVFLENHLKTISDFYINKKVEKSTSLMQFAKRKKDSLQAIMQGKTYGLANMQDQGFGVVMRRAKVPEVQLNRDLAIVTQQYNESVLALSTATVDLERRRPFISVVDDIRLPLKAVWPEPLNKAIFLSIVGILVGIGAVVGSILGLDLLKKQRAEYKPES